MVWLRFPLSCKIALYYCIISSQRFGRKEWHHLQGFKCLEHFQYWIRNLDITTITLPRKVEERLPSHTASYLIERKPDIYLATQEIPRIF